MMISLGLNQTVYCQSGIDSDSLLTQYRIALYKCDVKINEYKVALELCEFSDSLKSVQIKNYQNKDKLQVELFSLKEQQIETKDKRIVLLENKVKKRNPLKVGIISLSIGIISGLLIH